MTIREQGRWLVRDLARMTRKSESVVEAGLIELVQHGHLKIIYGQDRDEYQPLIHGEDTSDLRVSAEDLS
jgi:hypothetical protein